MPFLAMAGVFLAVWRDPMAWDEGRWVEFGIYILAFEFVLFHSGVILGAVFLVPMRALAKAGALLGLVTAYGLFAWGLMMITDSMTFVTVYTSVTVGRMASGLLGTADGRELMMRRGISNAVVWMLITFATVIIPVPAWGITPEVLDLVMPDRDLEAIWERYPNRAIAGAALYFTCLALLELFAFGPEGKDHGKGHARGPVDGQP